MLHSLTRAAASLACVLAAPAALANTLYVDANLVTGLNDGTSWANAYQGIDGMQAALAAAVAGDEVWVADGLYRTNNAAGRGMSFSLANGVALYGGFQGGESGPGERPPFGSAPSILSGDLNGDDAQGLYGDNSYHVVRAGSTNATAVLDGFTLTGGNANGSGSNSDRGGGMLATNGSSPTVRNCHFLNNRCAFGGGAVYVNGGAPSFTDCTFEDNIGGSFGGAFDIAVAGAVSFDRCAFLGNRASRAGALEIFSTSGAQVSNSLFVDNVATGGNGGGAFWVGSGGSTTIRGCTIYANSATSQAQGGIRVQGASVTVANCIVWANTGPGGAQGAANQIGGTSGVTYSIIEGGFAGTGNLAGDPAFADPVGGDLTLTLASPAIDAGNNAAVLAGTTLDLARQPRFVDEPSVADTGAGTAPIVDIGAYEVQAGIGAGDPACTPLPNSTGLPSMLTATGSLVLSANDVDFTVTDLPANQFGYFLMANGTGTLPVASGILCLGAPQIRFNNDVLDSAGAGVMAFSPDLANLPQGTLFQPGETWWFQLWHRDLGGTSNFSNDLGFTWQ